MAGYRELTSLLTLERILPSRKEGESPPSNALELQMTTSNGFFGANVWTELIHLTIKLDQRVKGRPSRGSSQALFAHECEG